MGRQVYTVGTGTRGLSQFIALLKHYGVGMVVDVRRFPSSRFEHFKGEAMAESLPREGIGYYYSGDSLGGRRSGGYQAFATGKAFGHGVSRLAEIAEESRCAIVCSETLPWRCHRRFIGAELERRGWQVIHIIDEERTWCAAR